jgi:RNase adaptor protein for sRNA GlmZ degradation
LGAKIPEATILYNESKHNILAFLVGKANKLGGKTPVKDFQENQKHYTQKKESFARFHTFTICAYVTQELRRCLLFQLGSQGGYHKNIIFQVGLG